MGAGVVLMLINTDTHAWMHTCVWALCDLVTCVDLRKHYGTRGEELLTATKLPRLPLCCEPPLGPLTHPPRPQLSFRECRVRRCTQCVAFKAGFFHSARSRSSTRASVCVSRLSLWAGAPQWAGPAAWLCTHPPEEGCCAWLSRLCLWA